MNGVLLKILINYVFSIVLTLFEIVIISIIKKKKKKKKSLIINCHQTSGYDVKCV